MVYITFYPEWYWMCKTVMENKAVSNHRLPSAYLDAVHAVHVITVHTLHCTAWSTDFDIGRVVPTRTLPFAA